MLLHSLLNLRYNYDHFEKDSETGFSPFFFPLSFIIFVSFFSFFQIIHPIARTTIPIFLFLSFFRHRSIISPLVIGRRDSIRSNTFLLLFQITMLTMEDKRWLKWVIKIGVFNTRTCNIDLFVLTYKWSLYREDVSRYKFKY